MKISARSFAVTTPPATSDSAQVEPAPAPAAAPAPSLSRDVFESARPASARRPDFRLDANDSHQLPDGGRDAGWVHAYKQLETWRKRYEGAGGATPAIHDGNRETMEHLRHGIRELEVELGLGPGQRAVVNGQTGEFFIRPP